MTERTAIAGRPLPPVVDRTQWERARAELLEEEKAHMRHGDMLAAKRRALPMLRVEKDYTLEGPDGPRSLADIFEGRNQLIVYHFMFHPEWNAGCDGCSWFADGVANVAHINARDVSFALVSRAKFGKLETYRRRMGWNLPWYSSFETTFNQDFGATVGDSEHHLLSVFLRDGHDIYLTYQTGERGTENLGTTFSLLDLVPFGRQERWQVAPQGWPQGDPYVWWRRHDEYDGGVPAPSTLLRE